MQAWFALRMRAYVADSQATAYIHMPFDETTLANYRAEVPRPDKTS